MGAGRNLVSKYLYINLCALVSYSALSNFEPEVNKGRFSS